MEMESRSGRHHQSQRRPRPPPLQLQPHLHGHRHARQPPNPRTRTRRNPSNNSPAANLYASIHMDDAAISTLMDVDASPRYVAAGFLDEEDGEGEPFLGGATRGGRGVAADVRGPLPFANFFNGFDGADFDDADLE